MKTQPFKLLWVIATLIALGGITHAGDEKDSSKKSNAPSKTAAAPSSNDADAAFIAALKAEDAAMQKRSLLMSVSVHEETFSLSIADAFALLRKFRSDADRYKEIVRRAEAGQARIERRVVLRVASDQQAKTEPINVGDTLNFVPHVGTFGIINITLIREVSRLGGYTGPSDAKGPPQPLFERQKITTSVMVTDGEPFLLGTLNPPFNNGVGTDQKEQRVWLDFLTVHALPELKTIDYPAAVKFSPVGYLTSFHEETFSLPAADADALLCKCRSDTDRYNEIVRRVEAGQARIERLMVLRTISGQQAKTESTEEYTYPTEHGVSESAPASQGNPPGAKPPAPIQPRPVVGAPGNFQTHNVGDTLTLTPQIGEAGLTQVNLLLEASRFAGCKGSDDGKGPQQPSFEVQRIATGLAMKDGEPCLLGTFNPPFNNGVAMDQKEKRVWLAFLTVHLLSEGKFVFADTERVLQLAVPDTRFTDARIADVLAFLTTQSRELDPNKRGLYFMLSAPLGKTQEKITLSLNHDNLFSAAWRAAKRAGLQMTVVGNRVTLCSKDEKP
ncbi:MAG: hypothetical protein WA117_03210 [Verrucomicrobiia bacterium]